MTLSLIVRDWIDHIVLSLSLFLTLFLVVRTYRRSSLGLRIVPLFFMFFGPALITMSMAGHIFEVSYHAVEAVIADTFKYDFRFYSLILLGCLLSYGGIKLIQAVQAYSFFSQYGAKPVIKAALFVVLLTAPTIPITPIGALPSVACVIMLAALPFVRKRIATLVAVHKAPEKLANA